MKIIAISGKSQHGKDTTAQYLETVLQSMGEKVLITHYADTLKYICRQFFGWNGEKDEKGRSILQYVGTDIVREQEPDFWVSFIVKILNLFPNEWDYVLIPDCRFPNEIEILKNSGFDVTHLRVVRDNFVSPLTEKQRQHPSETALDDVAPDYYIHNDGSLDDLCWSAVRWLAEHELTQNA
jgi:hypothetical protein